MWLDKSGTIAVTSRRRSMGIYLDSFDWESKIELRHLSDVHWQLADSYLYPFHSFIPELRRNGLRGKMPDVHPMSLMKSLLDNDTEAVPLWPLSGYRMTRG